MSEAARIDLVDRAPLTEKQQNVYESIMQYQRVNGYAPTIREICKMVGVASTSSVYAKISVLPWLQVHPSLYSCRYGRRTVTRIS